MKQYTPELEIPYGYCQCGCGQKTPLATKTSSKWNLVKGQPTHYIPKHRSYLTKRTQIERFWSNVAITADDNQCWLWTGSCDTSKYGNFYIDGKLRITSRIAWSYPNYVIPEGMQILHTCDNPKCCNPKHLFLGTQLENIEDRVKKDRSARNDASKRLDYDIVHQIRERYSKGEMTQLQLAAHYNVHVKTISSIIRRVTWKHEE